MIIKCNLSRIMGEKRYPITKVAAETGLARNTIAALYNEKAERVDFITLAVLCNFFQCEVGDLLETAPGEYDLTKRKKTKQKPKSKAQM